MKRIYLISILAILSAVTGCAVTMPVVGQFSSSREPFMGEASAALVGTGSLRIQSQSGVVCAGTLERPTSLQSGNGEVQCTDGRTGTFVFSKSNEYGGTGFGSLSDGEKFNFNWGNETRRPIAEREDVNVCAMANAPFVDDGISDASTVALALSVRCNNEYQMLVETLASELRGTNQILAFKRQANSQESRVTRFLPFVMQNRVSRLYKSPPAPPPQEKKKDDLHYL
jgi:hypothetical protein